MTSKKKSKLKVKKTDLDVRTDLNVKEVKSYGQAIIDRLKFFFSVGTTEVGRFVNQTLVKLQTLVLDLRLGLKKTVTIFMLGLPIMVIVLIFNFIIYRLINKFRPF